jgi:hypothetical protein
MTVADMVKMTDAAVDFVVRGKWTDSQKTLYNLPVGGEWNAKEIDVLLELRDNYLVGPGVVRMDRIANLDQTMVTAGWFKQMQLVRLTLQAAAPLDAADTHSPEDDAMHQRVFA